MFKNALFRDLLITLVLTVAAMGFIVFHASLGSSISSEVSSSVPKASGAVCVGYDDPAVKSTLEIPWARARL